MPDVAKLKKKAAEFELKKQFDKALAAYVEILDSYDRNSDEEVDLALYNRVGDLFLKQGNVADAVDYYERAVDRYAEGGFFNNAIALCNKILRNSPGRASVYYKLGKISAQKGFKGDAKANFLEYADRMQQAGKIDESFRALKEFADLCPDQDDIRLMLAEQLTRKGRGPEAIEQLQTLYERYTQEGRNTEATATIQRMKAIDPSSEPRAAGDAPRRAPGDLVFLDLHDAARNSTAKRAMAGLDLLATGDQPEVKPQPVAPPAPAPAPPPPPVAAVRPPAPVAPPEPEPEPEPVAELEMIDVGFAEPEVADAGPELDMYVPDLSDDMTREVDFDRGDDPGNATSLLEGLETTSFDGSADSSSGSLLDFEPTSFGPPAAKPPARPIADLAADLIDFDGTEERKEGPREVAPREVLRPAPPPAAPVRPAAVTPVARPAPPPPRPAAPAPAPRATAPAARPAPPPAAPPATPPARPSAAPARPSLHDLPMLDSGPSSSDEPTIGGDLELIMPEEEVVDERDVAAARRRTPMAPMEEIPLMDLDLPVAGEAAAGISGWPTEPVPSADDLEMIDLATPAFELDTEPDSPVGIELTPAEIDVRAELDLHEPPIVRDAVSVASDDSGTFDTIPQRPRRSSTMMAAQSVEMLRAELELEPDNHGLRRRLGEAMLESGEREGGIGELEAAMVGYERNDELSSAASIADEIVRLNPGSVRHHQKRVEYAFRTNEKGRLIDAYLQLADALFRTEQIEKSRAIYQRVLDLAPDDIRANAALQAFPEVVPEPAPPPPPKGRATTGVPRAAAPLKPITRGDDEFVNLGDWLRDDAAPKDTRMVVEEKEPTGDEEADFQDMLRKFKQGIAENVEDEDHQSHYDLGVAYKEMGLLDEAIAEFQKALRGPANRVSTYEALGQCFIEKEQYPVGATILTRALHEKGVTDDQLVGVLYLLGVCAEQRGQFDQAAEFYQRVFVIDIQFRDVGDRLAAVEGAL